MRQINRIWSDEGKIASRKTSVQFGRRTSRFVEEVGFIGRGGKFVSKMPKLTVLFLRLLELGLNSLGQPIEQVRAQLFTLTRKTLLPFLVPSPLAPSLPPHSFQGHWLQTRAVREIFST